VEGTAHSVGESPGSGGDAAEAMEELNRLPLQPSAPNVTLR